MDKNGNFRITINVMAQLLVDKLRNKALYEEARSFYMSFVAKGKFVVNEVTPEQKILTIVPKNAEVQSLKIFKSNGDEQVVEQMVLTSGINLQLEQMFKMLEPKEFPMQNLPQYKEIECLGFQLSDF